MTAAPGEPFPSEAAMRVPVRAWLEARGYRVHADPDGTDYFDLVARRGSEIGVIELKRAAATEALGQALRRRRWASWVAVALARRGAAARLAAATGPHRAAFVGVWHVRPEGVEVLREARPVPSAQEGGGAEREVLVRWLDALDAGTIPSGTVWSGLHRTIGRLSGGRRYREWSLEELDGGPPTR
ncbi:MAG: hypothetical protein QXG65_00185 [Thermoplasmata archaeon]